MIKISIRKSISNNLYILKLLCQIKPQKIWFGLLFAIWNSVLIFVTSALFMKDVINYIQEGKEFKVILVYILLVFLFQQITKIVNNLYDQLYVPGLDIEINKALKKMFFEKAASLDLSSFESPDYYNKYIVASEMLPQKTNDVLRTLCSLVSNIFVVLSFSTLMFMIEPLLILFALVPFIYNTLISNKKNKTYYSNYMDNVQLDRKTDYCKRVFYSIDYAKELRLSNIFKCIKRDFVDSIEKKQNIILRYFKRFLALDMLDFLSNNLIANYGTMFFVAFCAIIRKTILLGDSLFAINSISRVSRTLQSFTSLYQEFKNNSLYIGNIREFFEAVPAVREKENPVAVSNKINMLSFKNVSFKYQSSDRMILNDISFDISKNEKIAIVGRNGVGKTTLIKLLTRLYDVSKGEILLDNINIKNYKLHSYREQFGILFQEFQNFSFSIAENILTSEPSTDNDRVKVEEALIFSGLYNKVQSMKNGIDTSISKEFDGDGVLLSGGENQKLALARVFAKQCKIIVLDEPSSALDPLAEYQLFKKMLQLCEDKIVIFISHRLSSATLADKVLFIGDDGGISGVGSHEQLLKCNIQYADMFKKQSENYISEELENEKVEINIM